MRLTMKLSGGAKLLVEHVDIDGPVGEDEFRAAVQSVAERLGKKASARPGEVGHKKTAMRSPADSTSNDET